MPAPTPPSHLPGAQAQYTRRRGATRRLHNRRIGVVVLPSGDYQLHIAKALAPGEAAELRRQGHRDTLTDYILRDRVRYSLVTLSAEAFEAACWCFDKLKAKQQRKRA